MSLFIASLNSGSNGNCYYVGNHNEAVLIDAGISCRETERRMNRLGLDMCKVKAIFVSHEHADHINGINSICKKHKTPVYITTATLQNSRIYLEKNLINSFNDGEVVAIGDLSVLPFRKVHDADDPHSFLVKGNGVTIGVFTDLGVACKPLIHHFKQCNAAFLESNYDEQMLASGGYPFFLKKRITGGLGHLSNTLALQVFTTHRPPFMTHLILSHLSKNNNCPKLVFELFSKHAGDTEIIMASRDAETNVYEVRPNADSVNKVRTSLLKMKKQSQQMSMF